MGTGLSWPNPRRTDPEFHIRGAKGVHVWGHDDVRLLDMTSGWNVVNAGWGNEEIAAACQAAISELSFRPAWAADDSLLALEAEFHRLAPGYVMFSSCTGAEAVDNALKIARMATGRPGVLTLDGSYHGSSTGAAMASSEEVPHLEVLGLNAFRVSIPGPANDADLEVLRRLLQEREDIGAVVIETVASNAGCISLSVAVLERISLLAAQFGIVVICDEIGTGLNRTGSMFSFTLSRMRPDIILLGKALTNGFYPLSLCLASHDLVRLVDQAAFGSTYAASPLGCSAALATLAFHKVACLGERAAKSGLKLKAALETRLRHSSLYAGLHGCGLELALHVRWKEVRGLNPRLLLERLHEGGMFATVSAGDCALMLMPPLTIEEDQLAAAVDIVSAVLME